MNARFHDILKNKSKNIDKIVKGNYTGSYLNNTKWHELIDGLTTGLGEVYINYKLIYDDVIDASLFDSVDSVPYFIEPITYKEVEWIEFPSEYEYWTNVNNLKAGKTIYNQNTKAVKSVIDRIGEFRIDDYGSSVRLFAYI